LDNPPNPRRTMDALREMGYDSYASVLDIVDNAIDAQATHVDVSVDERAGDIIISIRDNGSGMDEETLRSAAAWVGYRPGSGGPRQVWDGLGDCFHRPF